MTRLPRRAVLRHLDRLAEDLTGGQLTRLRALAEMIDDEGRIPLGRVLEVATPGGEDKTAQAAFRQFRAGVTRAVGNSLKLVVDGLKSAPEGRFCWFEEDTTGAELAEMSATQARRIAPPTEVAPTAAEVYDAPPVTVYVSTQLLARRESDPTAARDAPNLRRIVEALLEASEKSDHRPSAGDVLNRVAAGNCVLIFDGLDEVLVHLDPHQGQVFTRTLRRAIEAPAPRSRLLLSCRTHYFRSIRDETTHFTGQLRDGPAARDYLALLMLPFDEEQIRAYLRANLPTSDVDVVLELIDSVHNLREIAERPLTLRMITEQLETIEKAKLDGRAMRAVDLYAAFVEQWLARDDGKHSLLPEQKQLLMEHLAAQLWRSGRAAWTVQDVE